MNNSEASKENVLIVLFDDKVERIESSLKSYLKEKKEGCEAKYDFDIETFNYSNIDSKISDAKLENSINTRIKQSIAGWMEKSYKKVIFFLDFELYEGERYVEINTLLRKQTIYAMSEISKEKTDVVFYLFCYTSIKENELYNYLIDNEDFLKEVTGDNFKIFKDGIRIIYDRKVFYSNRFEIIFQIFDLNKGDYWIKNE